MIFICNSLITANTIHLHIVNLINPKKMNKEYSFFYLKIIKINIMEKTIKNCTDESFSENNIRNLLNRITWGFDDASNSVFLIVQRRNYYIKKNN